MNKFFYKFLQWSISIACLYIIFQILKNEGEYKQILYNKSFYNYLPSLVISIIIIFLFCLFIRKTLLLTTNLSIDIYSWSRIFLNSQFYNTIPFLGFVYRALKLKKYNLDFGNYIFSYLFILWLWSIIYLIYFSIEFFLFYLISKNFNFFWLTIFLIFCSFFIFTGLYLVNSFLNKFNNKLIINFNKILIFCKNSVKKKNNVAYFFKYSFIIHIFEFFLYFYIIKFLDLKIDFTVIFLIFAINSIIDLFPITPQNLGFSELLSSVILNLFGFSLSTGILIKLFVRLSNILSIALLFFINNLIFIIKK